MRVGFVDCEGQGDRDSAYDARIACPVLLSAKCVIFNWRDTLLKDRILDLLGVMCRAASTVDLGSGNGSAGEKPFGHLHIVFRDWNFEGDQRSVEAQLLGIEVDADGDGAKRNVVRRALAAAFESLTVWLLPPPTERVADLRKVITNDMLSPDFNAAVRSLRGALCAQLVAPRRWGGQPLTGPRLADFVPKIAQVPCNASAHNQPTLHFRCIF